ncbi:MAG: SRPBCC family protein [Thermoleophilia bacterium]|nr:SRPBCC family protein [Thermoleophilia bacterium]
MPTATESKVFDHDVHTVYNQWTQFEDFPRFMDGVERVEQLDDKRLHWVAEFGGSKHEWDAEITDQVPDQRIAWRSIDGKTNTGQVTFRPAESGKTEVTVEMGWEPEGLKEKIGGALGFDNRQIKGDLERLESVLDERGGQETGAWRGWQR